MPLHLQRYRVPSYFGVGCFTPGHSVPVRTSNGSLNTRPPFEHFSNFLTSFPNEAGIAGLADFFNNVPSYGLYRESVPFYGRAPQQIPYDNTKDGTRAGIAALLSDLVFNGIEGVRRRSLQAAPSNESQVRHANLTGYLTNKPGRAKSVGYSGTTDGFPKFPSFQTAPATLNITSLVNDSYTLTKSSFANYSGKICYLVDALDRLKAKVAAGDYNTSPASAGLGSMYYSRAYSDLSWEINTQDPYAVSSLSYIYVVSFTGGPLFDSEVATFRITVSWETIPGPWVGIGAAGTYGMLSLPNMKCSYNFTSVLTGLIVSNKSPDGLYKYGGYLYKFSEATLVPMHSTSAKEGYTEREANVVAMLATAPYLPLQTHPGKRLEMYHNQVLLDLSNFDPLRYTAFTAAVSESIEGLTSNFIETFSELSSILKLVDISAYVDLIGKIKSGKVKVHDILDILTSSYLMVKYGIVPLLADAQVIATELGPAVSRIRQLEASTVCVYGTSSITLPTGTYGYNTVRVVASSKVVGRFNLSTFFLANYFADAIGFLPTFERIWDLVQWSFVVDMFANIDDRLKIFDDGLKTVGFVLQYHVSSVRVTAELDSSILDGYGLQSIGSAKPELVHFERNISKYAPRLGFSAYDITSPGQPDWFSIGSLIFQAVK